MNASSLYEVNRTSPGAQSVMVRPNSSSYELLSFFNGDASFGDSQLDESGLASGTGAVAFTTSSRRRNVSSTSSRTQTGFVQKLFAILSDSSLAPYIWWSHGGSVFTISHLSTFSQHVLPSWFKHSNFQSFVRQLNMYSFHKYFSPNSHGTPSASSATLDAAGPSWEFHHPSFHRDHPELLCTILRKPTKDSDRDHARAASAATAAPKSFNPRSPSSSRGISVHSSDKVSESAGLSSPPADWRALFPLSPPVVLQASTPTRSTAGSQAGGFDIASRVASLTISAQLLTRALDRGREDMLEEQRATTSIMWMLLNLVASLDVHGNCREQIELAHAALMRHEFSPAQVDIPHPYGASSASSSHCHASVAPQRKSTPFERQPGAPSWSRSANTSELHHSGDAWGFGVAPEYRARAATGLVEPVWLPQVPPRPRSTGESGGEAILRLPSFGSLLLGTPGREQQRHLGDEGWVGAVLGSSFST